VDIVDIVCAEAIQPRRERFVCIGVSIAEDRFPIRSSWIGNVTTLSLSYRAAGVWVCQPGSDRNCGYERETAVAALNTIQRRRVETISLIARPCL